MKKRVELKKGCRAAPNYDVNIGLHFKLDGVLLKKGDCVLLAFQKKSRENGIYIVNYCGKLAPLKKGG